MISDSHRHDIKFNHFGTCQLSKLFLRGRIFGGGGARVYRRNFTSPRKFSTPAQRKQKVKDKVIEQSAITLKYIRFYEKLFLKAQNTYEHISENFWGRMTPPLNFELRESKIWKSALAYDCILLNLFSRVKNSFEAWAVELSVIMIRIRCRVTLVFLHRLSRSKTKVEPYLFIH